MTPGRARLDRLQQRRLKLNVGCGHDVRDVEGVDVVANLDDRLPFPAGSAKRVLLDNVLEHVERPYAALLELHRVLEPGGELVVRVPHWRSLKARIVTHRHLFDVHSLDPLLEGRHREESSPENRAYFRQLELTVSHRWPFAWHQRRYFGRELLAWGPHEIEWRLRKLTPDGGG